MWKPRLTLDRSIQFLVMAVMLVLNQQLLWSMLSVLHWRVPEVASPL
jgi:hypothetical protein